MTVVAAGLDQGSQGELVPAGAAAVLTLGQRAQAQGGGRSLKGTHRIPVVPKFGVVIVLNDGSLATAGPGDELLAATSGKHYPGETLVGKGDQDGEGRGVLEGRDAQTDP